MIKKKTPKPERVSVRTRNKQKTVPCGAARLVACRQLPSDAGAPIAREGKRTSQNTVAASPACPEYWRDTLRDSTQTRQTTAGFAGCDVRRLERGAVVLIEDVEAE